MKPRRRDTLEIPYRADIDGLRAIAVAAVIGFHASSRMIPGGFVGVDIFFVVSGFLISSLIYNKLQDDSFSFLEFYGRRIRRLFPALAVVLLTTLILGWFTLSPAEYAALGRHTLGGAAFVANIQSYHEVGYFDAPAATKPLLHLWSLGVEEQFYFVFPALMLLAWRYRMTSAFALFGILSFGLNVALVHDFPSFTFYLPLTRFWEFIAGALLTPGIFNPRVAGLPPVVTPATQVRRDLFAAAGAALVVVSIGFTSEEGFPGWWAVLPVLGSVLLIDAGPQAWINRNILARPGLVFIGLISYPLYLWHWPLLVIGRTVMDVYPNQHARTVTIAAIVLTFVLSWLTYEFIEQPIRSHKSTMSMRGAVARCVLGMTAVACLGLAVALDGGVLSRFPKELQPLMTPLTVFADLPPEDESKNTAGPLLVTYGDSHSIQLLAGLRFLQNERTFRLVSIGWDLCAPTVHSAAPFNDSVCRNVTARNEKLFADLKPDIVVIAAFWGIYLHIEKISDTVRFLQQIGVHRIILLGQVPNWRRPLQEMLYRAYKNDPLHRIPDRLTTFVPEPRDEERRLKDIASRMGVRFISAHDVFCNQDGCLARLGPNASDLVEADSNHLSAAGSRFLVDHIADQIFD